MGKDFYDTFLEAKETFQEADELLSQNFSGLIFEGPASELTLTKNSQLAIFIVSVALLRTLEKQFPEISPSVCAGLSLGEYSALYASQKLDFASTLLLVRDRALYMHEACLEKQGSMRVVLGLESDQVEEIMREVSQKEQVWVANLNCPGQVVLAGSPEGLDAASEVLKQKGAKRVLPLEVSGAFHTPFMEKARARLAPKISAAGLKDSSVSLVMNVPGDFVNSVQDIKRYMIDQVTSPVRWEKGVRAIALGKIDHFLEIGPGTTLSGMNRKIGVMQSTCNLQKIADLEEIAKMKENLCTC